MANPVLQFLITAKDEASAKVKGVGGALDSLASSLGRIASGALGAVTSGLRNLVGQLVDLESLSLVGSTKAAEDLERQMGKLDAVIQSTGGAAGLTAEEIDAMARRLDEATLGSAAGFRDAASELLTFKNISGDSFEQVLMLAQDMADLFGGDVTKATVQLGKALEDPANGMTALRRVGVSFTDDQKALITSMQELGNTAGAQAEILKILEGQLGGAAGGAGSGLAGAVDLVGKRMTDLKESVGAVAIPLLSQFNLAVAEVIKYVAAAAKELTGPMQEAVKNASGSLQTLGEGIGQWLGQSIRNLGEWVKGISWQDIEKGAEGVKASLQSVADSFTSFQTGASAAIDVVTIAWNSLTAGFRTIGSGIVSLVSAVVSGLATAEETAAKIGLGSVERANELRQTASNLQQTADDLFKDVKRDAAEMGAAFDNLTENTQTAASAQQDLRDALPVAELQELTYTLDDYRVIAERANAEAEAARINHENGAISAEEYGQKLLTASEANTQLKDATEKQSAETKKQTDATQSAALSIDEYRKKVETLLDRSQEFRAAQEASAAAATKEAQAALELAQAKGHEQEIREAVLLVQQREVEEAQAANITRQAELQILENKRRQLIETVGGIEKMDAAQQLELATLDQSILVKERDIAAGASWIEVQQREAAAAERAAGPIGQLIDLYEQKTAAAERETDAISRGYNSKLRDLDVEIKQAEAKGDTARAAQLSLDVKQEEAEKAQALADANARELQTQIGLLEAKKLAIPFDERITAAGQERIEQINAEIAALRDSIDAGYDHAAALQAQADAADNVGEALSDGTENLYLFGQGADDVRRRLEEMNESAEEGIKDTANQAKGAGELVSKFYNSTITYLSALSEQAVAAFKENRGEFAQTTDSYADSLDGLREHTEKLDASIRKVTTKSGFIGFLTKITADANNVAKSFLGQATAAERLAESLEDIGRVGGVSAGALQAISQQAQSAIENFSLLDEERLERLRAALDSANQKLRQMQQETLDAANRLAELNAELLEAQGADQKAQLLRQQLDYQQKLTEIEQQRQEAELYGNTELVSILEQQRSTLEQINRTRVANIQAETEAANASERTAKATNDLASNADRIERIAGAMQKMGGVSLSGLVSQSDALNRNFSRLNRLL